MASTRQQTLIEIPGAVGGRASIAASGTTASTNSRIYDLVKERILSNQFRPGTKLNHQDLAELFQVSRTPIREALERLYQEGFVVHYHNRGFYVAEIDGEEARELFDTREALEIHALRRSLERGVKFQISSLKKINKSYSTAVQVGQTKERMLLDRDFHLALASHCGNNHLVRSLEAIFERIILKLRVDGYLTHRGIEAHNEHLELLDAASEKNSRKMEKILSAHIQAGYDRLLEQL